MEWASWQDFVLDPDIRLLGLQAVQNLPDGNLLVFDHSCGSSISLFAKRIRHLMPNPGAAAKRGEPLGLDECRPHCQQLEELANCDRPCVRARDRRLVQWVLQLKRGSP